MKKSELGPNPLANSSSIIGLWTRICNFRGVDAACGLAGSARLLLLVVIYELGVFVNTALKRPSVYQWRVTRVCQFVPPPPYWPFMTSGRSPNELRVPSPALYTHELF